MIFLVSMQSKILSLALAVPEQRLEGRREGELLHARDDRLRRILLELREFKRPVIEDVGIRHPRQDFAPLLVVHKDGVDVEERAVPSHRAAYR